MSAPPEYERRCLPRAQELRMLEAIQRAVKEEDPAAAARAAAPATTASRVASSSDAAGRVRRGGRRRAVADDAVLVTVANVETYRGFLTLTPEASPIDGRFDVAVMPRVSKAVLLLRLLRPLLRLPGRRRPLPIYRGRRVVVTTPRRRDELTVWRRALPLLVPRGAIEGLGRRTVDE